ncbi:lipopolysaccharide biosynthesis protein [Panacagrimonas perspica]|uniref:lipopolysaccharide biosynthesis protein n=1 Tax=Panacagrimonas perspica TaxID=381431 RepID=UPI001B37F774|nr:lipopolysaccharide biosynthesis protein [Panacagrimonas perspica]
MANATLRRLAGSRVARIFGGGVMAQAMLSAANFVVSLLLLRFAGAEQYGYFVLVQVSIALLTTAQGAWVNGPLSVLAPRRPDADRDRMVALIRRDQRRYVAILAAVVLTVPLGGFAAGLWSAAMAGLIAAGAVSGALVLLRELSRQALTIGSRVRLLLIVDGVYVVSLLTLIGLAVIAPGDASTWAVLAIGSASGLAVIAQRRVAPDGIGAVPASGDRAETSEIWRAMRPLGIWATVGASIYWVQSQSFNYTLASVLSVEAVAHVNAVRLMLMPISLLMMGVGVMLLPNAARWLHQEGLPSLMRKLMILIAALMVLDLIYLAVLWVLRHWIMRDLMKADIPEADILLVLWALHALFATAHSILQGAALAMEMFRPLAWLSALSAIVALGAMWIGVPLLGSPGAIIGTAAGELTFLVGISLLLMQRMRQYRAAEASHPQKVDE